MKLVCDKALLSTAANHISRVVSAKSPMAALSGILLVAKNNTLTLSGYDLEIGMRTEIPAAVEENGNAVLDAKLFCDIVKRLPEDRVMISVDERNLCHITSGRSAFSLIGINADEYPELPTVELGATVTVDGSIIESMVRQTIFAVAEAGGPKPILSGIHFIIRDGEMKMVAVDGYRIAIRSEKVNVDADIEFTVPAKTMSEVLKLLGEEGDITLTASDRHIIFEVDGYKVISRLLEGDFFDYKRAIPKEFLTVIKGNTSELIHTIERISQVIIERLKTPIVCSFDEGVFHASCMTEIGQAQDEMNVEMSGDAVKIGFNSKYLLDALRAAEADEVTIKIGSPLSPISIMPISGDSFTFIVLPVKIR